MDDIVTSDGQPVGPPPPSPPPVGPVPRRWGLVAVIVAVVLSLGGVGVTVAVLDHRSDVRAEEQAERERVAEEKAEAARLAEEQAEEERLAREAEELAEKQEVYDDCVEELSPLLETLTVVDARLNVGLSQSDLSNLVGDVSVAYSGVDVEALGGGLCLSAGARLETAMNAYATSVSRWNDCIYDYGCDVDSIDPQLQAKWSSASRNIERAENLLDRLDPANGGGDSAGDQT